MKISALAVYSALIPTVARAYDNTLLPLQPNTAVVTCHSSQEGGFVLGIIDTRNPKCEAPDLPIHNPIPGSHIENWDAPMYHNEDGAPWNLANMGSEVFGLALDDEAAPNIYVLPTTVYGGSSAPQKVLKIDGTTGAKSELADLSFPGKNLGLGQIAYHRTHKQFYVTSFANGVIYRLDFNGNLLSTFDPFITYGTGLHPLDGLDGAVNVDERIWAVQVNYGESRLYFGTWKNEGTPFSTYTTSNEVWSVDLDASGEFVGTEQLAVDMGVTDTKNMPISDIAFSAHGDMLVAERSMFEANNVATHKSKAYRFTQNLPGDPWMYNSVNQYLIGEYSTGFNSAGGVDFSDCLEVDECNPYDLVFVTSDAIRLSGGQALYGLQITPAAGGGPADSWAVDFDGDLVGQDKTRNGDVEVVRACADAAVQDYECHDNSDCDQCDCIKKKGESGGYCRPNFCLFGDWNQEEEQCICLGHEKCHDGFCLGKKKYYDEELELEYQICDLPKSYEDGVIVPGFGACCLCPGEDPPKGADTGTCCYECQHCNAGTHGPCKDAVGSCWSAVNGKCPHYAPNACEAYPRTLRG